MYGGYGNLWNQASGQWPTGNLPVQNQNQLPIPGNSAGAAVPTTVTGSTAQSFQNQQSGMQQGNPPVGMANYANYGMQAGNPYMNYANPAMGMGYDQNAMAHAWSSNNANFQFQQQVYMQSKNLLAFPGGRPPLPPGPPPPDKPKEVKPATQNPPAKAPPPPPSLPKQSSNEASGFGASMLPNILNQEDAYNLIKSAAALGLIAGNGSLTPLAALNVSEELFGSKNSGLGIPGLDGAEDVPAATKTPEPEVIDLEKDSTGLKKEMQEIKGKIDSKPVTQPKIDNPWVTAADKQVTDKTSLSKKTDNKIVWELRPEVKNNDWTPASKTPSSVGTNNGEMQGKFEIQRNPNMPSVNRSPLTITKENPGGDKKPDMPKTEEPKVRIPLEPTDGQDVVYDKKTLKQFDHKFREWENQFEQWKQDNENHPNQANYIQYLDQWNLWREQLVEQRRNILDTMNTARMSGEQILFSNIQQSINAGAGDNRFSDAEPATSNINKSDLDKSKPGETQWSQQDSMNPFHTASNFETATSTSSMMPGHVNEMGVKDERSSANVERVLRLGSGGNSGRNTFEDNFQSQPKPNENPFFEKGSKAFEMGSGFGTSNTSNNASKYPPNQGSAEIDLPFEWSLPSQKSKNPFDMSQGQSMNPFMQRPTGPNPFDMAPQQKLPSLVDFIQRTNLDFSVPTTKSAQQHTSSSNPFESSESMAKPTSRSDGQVERISRDPQANPPKTNIIITPPSTIRLEANPVGMPLLRAAATQEDEQKADEEEEEDEFSHLFSRDRGPAEEEDGSNNVQFDDADFVEDAEVIDYGAGNSIDDMDFPRGEKADADNANDEEFTLEDSEVIDYSESAYPEHPPHDAFYEGGYPPGYDYEYPPFYPGDMRGRGRGRGGYPHPRGRGHFHGPVPFEPPYYGRMPPPAGPGYLPIPRGRARYPPGHPSWYEHDERTAPIIDEVVVGSPEVVELSSPSPESTPRVKIAPPEFDGESGRSRKRSVSGDRDRRRHSKDRPRSRSRDRVERVSRRREDSPSDRRGRRGGDSPHSSRRDRERERSPDSRRRQDDRRDRYRSHGSSRRRSSSRSRSRSPPRDTGVGVVRNPLFPSASSVGMMSSNQTSNPPAPRNQTILIEDILNKPSRTKRPQRIVIIMRGLPGSGKSHIVKLIKEREVEMGGKAPRILSLDNYFITEIENKEKDPATGVEVKKTVMEYEYDEEREPLYRAQLVRQFKKTIDDGYFGFVVVDGVNEYVRQFEEMASFATQKRFQVYVAEIEENVDLCVKRNTHKRTKDELLKIQRRWEKTPGHFIKLDTRALLQDEAVDDDVEMEDVSDVETDANVEKVITPPPTPAERGKIGPQVVGVEDIEDEDSGDHLLTSAAASKWDTMEQSQEKLNKLDGLAKRKRNNPENSEAEAATSIEMWLTGNLPDDYGHRRQIVPGQKRVRWADIEERREQEKMREMGFVVGHTDWNRMMDPTFGSSALTKTKFI